MPLRTLKPIVIALSLALSAGPAVAADGNQLPEIGSSAATLISPAEEARYGRELLGEFRRYGYLVDDPLVESWLQELGHRLAARSDRPEQDFRFFMVQSRQINAFATLGGYVGMNAGLVLLAEREDEVAAVLAHEVSHATQRHIVRSVEAAQKDALPITLAMLGALVAAQAAGGDGDASQAAIAGGLALMQQRQINYTRSNEHEADRIGIQILSRSGFDPLSMADFFGRLQRATRSQGDAVPDYLRTHPVTTTRISEAKDRAAKMEPASSTLPLGRAINPMLPGQWREGLDLASGPNPALFELARERLRVLSAATASEALSAYQHHNEDRLASEAERYGRALALLSNGKADEAFQLLDALYQGALASSDSHRLWFAIPRAEAQFRAGRFDQAEQAFESLLVQFPRNRAVALSYAQVLIEQNTRETGQRAQRILRPLLASDLDDAFMQASFARASELAGDTVRAAEAHAEAAFLSGRAEDALNQLARLKEREDLDYVQRARVDARMAEMTPVVLELRKRGIRPGQTERNVTNDRQSVTDW
ncbi:M48 family metalloprotease [Pseudomarimonas arenosa]|uniref:Putative beta-barrel assembly-enhancing protease n=1 Tax=Pseudomarimonas arenosa TaxID=2774145 RepID=A0AAW3ZLF6_9GAMM|nr:M48 family metalloprotease [Pseudomarimonas arenosa]MBD8526017.1 M48 family metallopeptidase [Pseudomarimonas arenosa]